MLSEYLSDSITYINGKHYKPDAKKTVEKLLKNIEHQFHLSSKETIRP